VYRLRGGSVVVVVVVGGIGGIGGVIGGDSGSVRVGH
jgi:hypothetical protein